MMREARKRLLLGRTALVTGATYGIGEAVARQLAGLGVNLILTARTVEKLEALKVEFESKGVSVDIFAADLYDMSQIEALTQFLEGRKIDIFVNNAGKSICRPIVESLDRMCDFTRTMAINYYAPVAVTLCLLKSNDKIRVVNVSTMNVLLPPTPYWAAYGSSKSALDYWMKSVGAEVKGRLSVGYVYFALVATRMIEPTAAYAKRKNRAMGVEKAASIVVEMVGSNARFWRPWWSCAAVGVARMFNKIYCRMAIKMIDNA